ncbi:ATP-binding protein [Viridibacillus arvi]|uniref:ATP-binding protein n=1 Tax=Viridibacillus arvi TaxID=263475 RepID=UPI0034CDEED6
MKIDFELLKEEFRLKGIDPSKLTIPNVQFSESELNARIQSYKELLNNIQNFLKSFLSSFHEMPILGCVNDSDGNLLFVESNKLLRKELKYIRPGACYIGPTSFNSIKLAIKYKTAISLIGKDHYYEYLHDKASYSVPIIDKAQDKLICVITIGSQIQYDHSMLLPLLMSLKSLIEQGIPMSKEKRRVNIVTRLLCESTNRGIVIINKEGEIIECNDYAEKSLSMSKKSLIGLNIKELKNIGIFLENVLSQRIYYKDVEVCYVDKQNTNYNKDDTAPVILFDASPIIDEEDKDELLGAFIQFKVITESKRVEEKLDKTINEDEKAAEQRTNFLYNMSHELRTPLNAINGFSYLLKMNLNKNLTEDELEYAVEINNASKHLLGIVNDLLNFALVETDRIDLELREVSSDEIIDKTIELIKPLLINKNVKITNEQMKKHIPPKVIADPRELRQVFINILSNATKYNIDNGHIFITYEIVHDKLEISIRDTGIGIAEGDKKKIFDNFFRSDLCKNIIDGSGIGLAVSRQILKKMGGFIKFSSELGKGSVFTVSLNIAETSKMSY